MGNFSLKSISLILKKTDSVTCELTGDKTYDRFVGICYINVQDSSVNLQKLIVDIHCARDCEYYSDGKYEMYETYKSKKLPLPNYCKKEN